jgi:hypothetical protein
MVLATKSSEEIPRRSCVAAFCDHSTPAEVSVNVFFIRLCYPPSACGPQICAKHCNPS